MILSLAAWHGPNLLVGTGMQGQLFDVNPITKERSEIARLEASTIHAILKRKDGTVVLGTGDPGKIYVLEDQYADKGTILSDVLDAKMPALGRDDVEGRRAEVAPRRPSPSARATSPSRMTPGVPGRPRRAMRRPRRRRRSPAICSIA